MFDITDKMRIYWLIDQYLSHKIKAWDFCIEYHICYDIEIDLDTLTDNETRLFSELSSVAGRFSDVEEDHKKYPGVYYTEQELQQKIIAVKTALNISRK